MSDLTFLRVFRNQNFEPSTPGHLTVPYQNRKGLKNAKKTVISLQNKLQMGVTWKAKLIQYQLKLLNCEQSHERNKQYLCPDMNLATFA